MSKPTGAICNLDCEYCFFLSKEELYPGSGFRMPPDVHEAYVSQLLAAQRGADEIVVAFQGGEPTLMGIDFFRRTLELEAQYAAPGQRILNTIQTNATLIDDEWAAFLASTGSSSACRSTVRVRCTMPSASTRAVSPRSTASSPALTR